MTYLRVIRASAWSVFSTILVSAPVPAQCSEWKSGFELRGANGEVRAFAVYDGGNGPALYAGGEFTSTGTAPSRLVARWDGSNWSTLGSGVSGPNNPFVAALAVFDDGTGPALFAAGRFDTAGGASANNIAKWDGSTWSPLGIGVSSDVFALTVFDDGTGSALYAGGNFQNAGGVLVRHVAKWDGATWQALQNGVNDDVYALTTFDDGTGTKLYAGGRFYQINGSYVGKIAAWDGASWSSLGAGIGSSNGPFDPVFSLAVFDDGLGPALFAGGYFDSAGGQPAENVARWNGSTWSALGSGTSNFVSALTVFDDGSGPALFAAGPFSLAGGASAGGIAKWRASGWSAVPGIWLNSSPGYPQALCAFDSGAGAELHAGGYLVPSTGSAINNVAVLRGTAWKPLGAGQGVLSPGYGQGIEALAVHDAGSGPALYAGGQCQAAGSAAIQNVARWNGSTWSSLGSGISGGAAAVHALASFPGGSGAGLYAGGQFTGAGGVAVNHIARWDGSAWSSPGGGIGGTQPRAVWALAVFDDGGGPDLYVGGQFTAPAVNIARWSGTNWSALGIGIGGAVSALAVYDDGTGPALYATGGFITAGGVTAEGIARWNGSVWSALSPGHAGGSALTVFDDGSGEALYLGGVFSSAGGVPANNVAKWDGAAWSALGTGTDGPVYSLRVWDDGSGPKLFAGGPFSHAGGVPANGIANWDGLNWSASGVGIDGIVRILQDFDPGLGGGSSLFAGGTFAQAGGIASSNVAELGRCAPGVPFCSGDGSLVPCPCGNDASPGRGCQNSAWTGGAALESAGTTNPDTVVLHVTDERSSALTIFLQGDLAIAPVPFGDGLRCAGGVLKRLYAKNANGGAASAPGPGDPSITARSAALGNPILSGTSRIYQTYYRDSNPGFCPSPQGDTFNSSGALSVVW